jgi:membrane-associated protease RseP (regulator of RpoE activity)
MKMRPPVPELPPLRPRPGAGARRPAPWRARLAGAAACLALGSGCAAIYPEVQTPARTPIAGQILTPPPGRLFVWVAIESAEVPPLTRDGRRWRTSSSGAPNPFAIVFVNGRELLRTNPRSDTYRPTWPDSPRGNFHFTTGDRVRVELWDAGLVNHPICVREIGAVSERWADEGRVEARCEDDGFVTLRWEPAHGRYGYGFAYEFRTYDVFVSRVSAESPAARAGLKAGDQIVSLNGRLARDMPAGEVRSYLNAPRAEGVRMSIKHEGGAPAEIVLKEGAIYPLFSEVGTLP